MSEVSIRWPNGETEVLRDVAAILFIAVVEGMGIQRKVSLPALPRPWKVRILGLRLGAVVVGK